jgi:hypothetical protein
MKVFAPKGRANIRIVHLLHPQDLIIYTALVLIVKNDIEAYRLPKKSQRIFSYRVDTSRADRLYNTQGTHDSYLDQLQKKSHKSICFYPRLCHQKCLTSLMSSEKLLAIPFKMCPAAKTNNS